MLQRQTTSRAKRQSVTKCRKHKCLLEGKFAAAERGSNSLKNDGSCNSSICKANQKREKMSQEPNSNNESIQKVHYAKVFIIGLFNPIMGHVSWWDRLIQEFVKH